MQLCQRIYEIYHPLGALVPETIAPSAKEMHVLLWGLAKGLQTDTDRNIALYHDNIKSITDN